MHGMAPHHLRTGTDQRMAKFTLGQSGNPGGRPAVLKTLQALAREHTEEAIQALVEALNVPATRVAAATALLDRGYGRPVQTANLRVIQSVEDLSTEELEAIAGDTSTDDDGYPGPLSTPSAASNPH